MKETNYQPSLFERFWGNGKTPTHGANLLAVLVATWLSNNGHEIPVEDVAIASSVIWVVFGVAARQGRRWLW